MSRVIVLGMHRSGTSAVTRVVNLLGLSLGREDDLYHAADNPDHWESSALIEANDSILQKLGGRWDAPPNLQEGWESSDLMRGEMSRLRNTFLHVYPEDGWVWKDPRTCLTLPLWLQ